MARAAKKLEAVVGDGTAASDPGVTFSVAPPNLKTIAVTVEGTTPYVQHRFGQKALAKMMATHIAGGLAKRTKEPRNFDEDYEQAKHVSEEGWCGIPANGIRAALVSACRTLPGKGVPMTRAKLAIFVEADGFDKVDGTPLVKITHGEPEKLTLPARNDNGSADIRIRPLWRQGWQAKIRLTYDADQLAASDVANLLYRAGMQVGIGEGRPDSKNSVGMGWGCFKVHEK